MRYFVALWLLLMAPLQAREVELFVRNQVFGGDTRYVQNVLFAPLDQLLDSLGCTWQALDGGYLWIRVGDEPSRGTPAPLTRFHRLLLEGRPLQVSQQLYSNRVYVDVEQLAQAVGAPFRINRQARTADLLASPLSLSRVPGIEHGSPVATGSKLGLEDLQYAMDGSMLRGYMVLRNNSQNELRGVVARVVMVGNGGKVLGRMAQPFGKLAADTRVTWQFPGWLNLLEPGSPVKLKAEWEYLAD